MFLVKWLNTICRCNSSPKAYVRHALYIDQFKLDYEKKVNNVPGPLNSCSYSTSRCPGLARLTRAKINAPTATTTTTTMTMSFARRQPSLGRDLLLVKSSSHSSRWHGISERAVVDIFDPHGTIDMCRNDLQWQHSWTCEALPKQQLCWKELSLQWGKQEQIHLTFALLDKHFFRITMTSFFFTEICQCYLNDIFIMFLELSDHVNSCSYIASTRKWYTFNMMDDHPLPRLSPSHLPSPIPI